MQSTLPIPSSSVNNINLTLDTNFQNFKRQRSSTLLNTRVYLVHSTFIWKAPAILFFSGAATEYWRTSTSSAVINTPLIQRRRASPQIDSPTFRLPNDWNLGLERDIHRYLRFGVKWRPLRLLGKWRLRRWLVKERPLGLLVKERPLCWLVDQWVWLLPREGCCDWLWMTL